MSPGLGSFTLDGVMLRIMGHFGSPWHHVRQHCCSWQWQLSHLRPTSRDEHPQATSERPNPFLGGEGQLSAHYNPAVCARESTLAWQEAPAHLNTTCLTHSTQFTLDRITSEVNHCTSKTSPPPPPNQASTKHPGISTNGQYFESLSLKISFSHSMHTNMKSL